MPRHDLDDVKRLWDKNENFWNAKIRPELLIPLQTRGGVRAETKWQYIVAVTFGRSLETFQAVQLLSNPHTPPSFWADGFILTRGLFESYVTLKWIALELEQRVELFLDEYALKIAHTLDQLSREQRDLVRPARQEAIISKRREVLQRRNLGEGRLRLMPSIESRVSEIEPAESAAFPGLRWEYEVYYRDVSSFAHLSGWGLFTSLGNVEGTTHVESTPEVGFKALLCNGGLFFRLLNNWNEVFHVLGDSIPMEWLNEWNAGLRR